MNPSVRLNGPPPNQHRTRNRCRRRNHPIRTRPTLGVHVFWIVGWPQPMSASPSACSSDREQVIPEPVVIDRRPLWSARLLDGCVEAITRARGLQTTDAGRPEAAQSANSGPRHSAAKEAAVLPDEEWLERRADLVRRIRRSPLSQHELSMLHEFNLLQGREASMFGFYRTFEALMARGLVVEVSRSGPISRPLVTYRLTDAGAKIAGSMKDSKV